MEKGTIIGLVILLGLVIGGLFVTGIIQINKPTGKVIDTSGTAPSKSSYKLPSSECVNEAIPYEVQEEYIKTEYYLERVPYTGRECEAQSLNHKVERGTCQPREDNFFANDEPSKFSCTITNLDSEGGTFGMILGFNINGQKLEETQNRFIYSQSSETFRISRDAAVDSCYCLEQVPTKQVCRDVTKYEDVQRERQVTAYRPVTKYRYEERCS